MIIFGTIVCCLFLAYLPAFRFGYIHHDDALFFLSDWIYKIYGCFVFNFFSGRFLGAFILEYAMVAVNTVPGLALVRLLAFAVFSLCALILFLWYRRYLLKTAEALMFVLIVFTLPYFEIVVSYAGIFFHSLGVLSAIGAGALACHVSRKRPLLQALGHPLSVWPVFLLVCALSIYQSSAVFYWALLGPILLFAKQGEERLLRRQAAVYFALGFIALIIYAGLLQITKQVMIRYSQLVYNPYDLSFAFGHKLVWFFQEPLMNSLNLWNVFPSTALGLGVLALILASLAFFGLRYVRDMKAQGVSQKDIAASLGWKACAFGSLFFLSFLPNMLWSGDIAFYRCTLGPSFLVVTLLFWSLRQWAGVLAPGRPETFFSIILVVGLGAGIIFSNHNIYRWIAYPNHVELEFIKSRLAQNSSEAQDRAYLLQPGPGTLKERYDEFGFQTSNAPMDKVGFLVGALNDMVSPRYKLSGLKFDQDKEEISFLFADRRQNDLFATKMRIRAGTPGQVAADDAPGLVIDTTMLYAPGAKLHYLRRDINSGL